MPPLTQSKFREALTDPQMRPLQFIYVGLGVTTFFFALIIVFVSSLQIPSTENADGTDSGLILALTIVHFAIALGSFFVAPMLFKRQLANASSAATNGNADGCFAAIRTAMIVRVAIVEASAQLGIVVCFIAATNGVLAQNPSYWINLLTTLLLLAFLIITFPTRKKIENVFASSMSKV